MICAYPDFVLLTIDNDQIHNFLYENGRNPFDLPPSGQASENILPWKIHGFSETPPVRNRYYTADGLSMQRTKRFNSLLYYLSKEEDAEQYYATDGKGNIILKTRSGRPC